MRHNDWTADSSGFSKMSGCYKLVVREINGLARFMVLLSPSGDGQTPYMMLQSGSRDTTAMAMSAADAVVAKLAPSPAGAAAAPTLPPASVVALSAQAAV